MFVPKVSAPGLDASAEGKWFVVDRRSNVLLTDGDIPIGAGAPVEVEAVHLLGLDDGVPVWGVEAVEGAEVPEAGQWLHLRQLYGAVPEAEWALAGRAAQIVNWDRDHRYCGRCGTATEPHTADRARECPSCGLLSYPRLTPAVIVLIERDDGRALLAWGAQFPGRFYSALAGFVEPGESLEETVVREVKEEVGIDVADVRYFGSQPWPFPHSVMIGFNARHAAGEITIQEDEIVEAAWYHHEELPPVPRGGMSIAGWLIEDWVTRQRNG
ncbi:MAG: NAD(+) diphosphatase [Acidimicrobiales bacterium]